MDKLCSSILVYSRLENNMDYRTSLAKIGEPVPKWDLAHRLPISGWVGPDCRDDSTIFRLNSTFMEVSEQCHLIRQNYACVILMTLLMPMSMVFVIYSLLPIFGKNGWSTGDISFMCAMVSWFLGSLFFVFNLGRKEFFSSTRYSARFNRANKKIYASVRAAKNSKTEKGCDPIVEFDWDEKSIFCIHRDYDDGFCYWIRCYRVDTNGNVEGAADLGNDWSGYRGLEKLLAQWNYWCWYMNKGPEDLPRPKIFLPEVESIRECYMCCGSGISFIDCPIVWMLFTPFSFIFTISRFISMTTCSPPRWPADIIKKCAIFPNDPFDEPTGSTPVGWYAAKLAVGPGTYFDAKWKMISDWTGEPDAKKNAYIWGERR
jgi:hypothetical protein